MTATLPSNSPTINDDFQSSVSRSILGTELYNKVLQSTILIVGAGGIGCELLKDLVLVGFHNIHVLDLDTIDNTNLNRQFLFRKRHVGQSKAQVAREAVLEVRPNLNIKAHHGNIMDPVYGRKFFKYFDLVLNALDNNEARRYVNRMCLTMEIPLIDSGSTGYNGQIMPIINKVSRCFECYASPKQTGFPVCTIRSTPSKPEHCIAWAKYLFELLFGPEDESNLLSDLKSGLECDKNRDSSTNNGSYGKEFGRRVFNFAFDTEISKQANMTQAWEGKIPPRPLCTDLYESIDVACPNPSAFDLPKSKLLKQQVWSMDETVRKFYKSICQMFSDRFEIIGKATFDKDDDIAMDFVTAAANLRMWNFNIDMISRWDAESIAGSIIPAIVSTNAIVSGMQVIQALHTLRWKLGNEIRKDTSIHPTTESLKHAGIKHVWVKQSPLGRFILFPEELESPSSGCYICQCQTITLKLHSLEKWTLFLFISQILTAEFGCTDPVVELDGVCIYDPDMEEDDEDFTSKKNLSLRQWGFLNGSSLFIVDSVQGFECDVIIYESPEVEQENSPDQTSNFYSIDKLIIKKGSTEKTSGKRLREEMEGSKDSMNGEEVIDGQYDKIYKKRKLYDTIDKEASNQVNDSTTNCIDLDSENEFAEYVSSIQATQSNANCVDLD